MSALPRLSAALGAVLAPSAADRVVPPTGFTARLTLASAAAMAFLAVFALALALATGRLAERWSEGLARSATVRISAPAEQMAAQTKAVLDVLATTPGVASSRALESTEIESLLAPFFGPDLPISSLPLPQLVEVVETPAGFDPDALRLRLAAEAPGAVIDDHSRWRRPLVAAAGRIRTLGLASLLLIAAATAGMITLAAQAALAANGPLIKTLRLVGARDSLIARAFIRRFTLRALAGASLGTALAALALALVPSAGSDAGFLAGLGLAGADWFWLLLIPPVAALVALGATAVAARRVLSSVR